MLVTKKFVFVFDWEGGGSYESAKVDESAKACISVNVVLGTSL